MTSFDKAYNDVAAIVREFEEHHGEFLAHKYQESEVRTDFIDKFFTALGWDVAHREQTNPREREVKIEKSDTAGSTRRVDYAFYLKPDYRNPVFFCEAKKPSRDLNNPEDYFQLVRYGYGASTPVGALTNFDEFHIIDCRYQPHIGKSYPSAQIKVFGYKDYLDKEAFGYIYWLFSREAVESGKLKDFAKSLPKQQGKGKAKLTAEEAKPVDEAFLTKLEEYRLILAKAFKKADETLNAEVLTEATQKVIDRLVFIRFLEDKYIESDYIVDQIANHPLTPALKRRGDEESSPSFLRRGPGGGPSAWQKFLNWSKELDVKYNGVVFKPHDIDKPEWKAPDDKVFAELCADISHTHSKYLFTYIPIELLGSIYERFLGKVVTTTAKRAGIEDKPEVRKAGGVYYTPKYIVDYIVANTVGKILNNRVDAAALGSTNGSTNGDGEPRAGGGTLHAGLTPKEISKLRFADIACGSGSFLIAVYDTVLHHVEKWYNDHPDEARKAKCTEIEKGIFALSLKQKQQILLDNIYGVDIDRQAVEVAQLSLFLKLLESESGATAEQLSFERTKILPDLSKNIQCGNSLVEYDISDLFPLTDEEEKRIKPFSFQSAFREIMSNGGFDAIVGNPPYLFITELSEPVKSYYFRKFSSTSYRFDVYGLFTEAAINTLLKPQGYLGYIVPHTLLANDSFEKLRAIVLREATIIEIIDIGPGVFAGAKNETMTYIFQKGEHTSSSTHVVLTDARTFPSPQKEFWVDQSIWSKNKGYAWLVKSSSDDSAVLEKLNLNSVKLGQLCTINQGLRTGDNAKYLSSTRESSEWRKAVGGKEVARYDPLLETMFVYYVPALLDAPRRPEIFNSSEKIVIQEIRNITLKRRIIATYDNAQFICLQSTNVINLKSDVNIPLKFILGVLNSSVINFFFTKRFSANNHIASNQLSEIPFKIENSKLGKDISSLVDQMLLTKQRLANTIRDSDREQLQNKCAYLDGEIDKLVYQLYGLTEEEIKVIEKN